VCAILQVELRVKDDEIAQIKAEAVRVNRLREQTAKRIKQLEDGKAEVRNLPLDCSMNLCWALARLLPHQGLWQS
jgi:hypothetical protein